MCGSFPEVHAPVSAEQFDVEREIGAEESAAADAMINAVVDFAEQYQELNPAQALEWGKTLAAMMRKVSDAAYIAGYDAGGVFDELELPI